MKIQGFNHITISVRNIETSLGLYVDILNMTLVHRGTTDVYLEGGSAWVCLIERSCNSNQSKEQLGVDHLAFSISEEDFQGAVQVLRDKGVDIVRGPVQRGKGWSVNFLDPDGTELELHTSNLSERMKVWN